MRKLLLASGACVVTLCLTAGSALADPLPPFTATSPQFRVLAGVGAETTQGLFNALSDIIKDNNGVKIIASYGNGPPGTITTKPNNPACVIPRPNQGGAGTTALVASLRANGGADDGCVDFSRVAINDSATRPPGLLTYVPVAIDVLTYAVRSDTTVPRNLTIQQLTDIYSCSNPAIEPLLPVFGSDNRTIFLGQLGIVVGPCVKDVDQNSNPLLDNDGRLITKPNQLVTYSSAPFLGQVNNVTPDKHGKALLGSINGISPHLPNPALPAPSNITYATRSDSSVPRNLSLGQLADIYSCVNTTFKPLLPPAGATRTAFLNLIGVNDPPPPCVGTATAADDGRVLATQLQLVPYDIQPYLNQVNNVTFDIHANAVLGSLGASSTTNPPTSPTVLNNASVMKHDVYDVIPTANIGVEPWKSVFTTDNTTALPRISLVCANTATILRQGFNPDPNCGFTAIHS